MEPRLQIPVDILRQAAAILLRDLASEHAVVSLDSDYFWAISPEQRTNVYVEPSEFTIGQLSDCLDNLSQIVDDPALSVPHGLVWLADLLRAVGEAVER